MVGVAPAYFGLTRRLAPLERQRVLRQSVIAASAVSVVFALVGKAIFVFLGITVADFQVAGGLILLGIAGLDLLTSEPRGVAEGVDVGVVPIGVPLIAGPAVITTTIVLVDLYGATLTIVALIANLALCWLVLAHVEAFERLVGRTGARALSKIVSLLMAAIGVRIIRAGVSSWPH